MSKRSKYTEKEKLKILQEYDNGDKTVKEIVTFYKINISTFRNWRHKYGKYGIDGLKESRTIKFYLEEMKENAVKDYLSGKFSRKEVTRMNGVSKASV